MYTYLHTIYLGVRLRLDTLQLAPQLPPRTTSLAITGLDYYGAVVDIQVTEASYIWISTQYLHNIYNIYAISLPYYYHLWLQHDV